jgi:hypothetical protein
MKSRVRKCAVGAVAVGSLLVIGPGGLAYGAQGTEGTHAALRACVAANHAAGERALNVFRRDIRAARKLSAEEQQAAVDAARAKLEAAANAAHDALVSCVNAAKG